MEAIAAKSYFNPTLPLVDPETNIKNAHWIGNPNCGFLNTAKKVSGSLGENRQVLVDSMILNTYDASIGSAHKLAEMERKIDKIGEALHIDFQA